jgi:NAD(P)-dependent dehydrogenase (short-subunit alcohol dehydrogenase family)
LYTVHLHDAAAGEPPAKRGNIMRVTLKPLSRQVMVITGASSGIGLVTARMAAAQGAKVVVAARNAPALHRLAREIEEQGGQALSVPTDVTHDNDVHRLADAAVRRFGGFDTWVNNAGISIYGRIEEVSLEDQRQLFETNFWGLVYGSKVAIEHLQCRQRALGPGDSAAGNVLGIEARREGIHRRLAHGVGTR